MKKSELKDLIRECINESKLDEAKNTSSATAKEVNRALRDVEKVLNAALEVSVLFDDGKNGPTAKVASGCLDILNSSHSGKKNAESVIANWGAWKSDIKTLISALNAMSDALWEFKPNGYIHVDGKDWPVDPKKEGNK